MKISAVTWGEFDQDESKTFYDRSKVRRSDRIGVGDFLFSRANTIELVGACVLVKGITKELYLSDKVLRLCFVGGCEEWLLHYLRCPIGRSLLEGASSGNQMSMRNISQSRLRRIPVPIAPRSEAEGLLRMLNGVLSRAKILGSEGEIATNGVISLEESILAMAFRGELVPKDPNDEPASVLLERIRVQRAEEELKGKKRSSRAPRRGGRRASRKSAKKATDSPSSTKANPSIGPNPIPIVLDWLRANPGSHTPAEILVATNLDRDLWPLIRPALTNHPNIKITGRKRGMRYEYRQESERN